jgi:hypothetical protein
LVSASVNLTPASAFTAERAKRNGGSFSIFIKQGGHSMPRKEILDRTQKYTQPFRITKGASFKLKNYDPGDT